MARGSILDKLVQQARILATQGSADAFVTAQLSTGISTAARFGWMIHQIDLTLAVAVAAAPQTSDCDVVMQVTQGEEAAALQGASAAAVICERRIAIPGIAAAVNAYPLELVHSWKAPPNYVIVDPTVNLALDSTNTGVANSVVAVIHYFPVMLDELDILRLIALR
jgi:hypothetical protein